jgi:ribosome maturation factor RimP
MVFERQMGAQRPFSLKGTTLSSTHEKERTLQRQIQRDLETAIGGIEVLAVELSGHDRMTVFIDHPAGVDHALCARATEVLRPIREEYAVDVSSPGIERPLRTPQHFRGVVGRVVALRTANRKKKLSAEVVEAGESAVVVKAGDEAIEIPYEQIVRGNLTYTESENRG